VRRYPFVKLLLLIVVVWIVGAVLLLIAEGGAADSEYRTLPDALWNITVILFSGLEKGIPRSAVGKIVVTFVLVLSIGLVAILTGNVASFLVERRLGRRRRMPSHELKDHIVICNWNDKGVPCIRELHAPIVTEKRPIVVISDSEEAATLPEHDEGDEFEDVYLVKGDPANEVILRRANVQYAYSAIVLADPRERELADAKNILISMAIRSVCKATGQDKTHICVEGVNPQNVEHLRRAGADEIVSACDFSMMLLSQAALVHGLSKVYRNLLTVSGETNEVYIVPIPQAFVGKTFAELGAAMFQKRDRENPAILIGARTAEGILVNPRQDRLRTFQKGDQAVVIAFEQPGSLV
jgi:voltage-gated potassium channel